MKQPETCEISQTAAGGKVDELAMLVRQLVHSLRRASPSNDLADRALDYLKRHGLAGTVLRGNSAFIPDDVPAGMKPSMASDAVGTSGGACRSESVPALQEALREAKCAINSMKTEAETAAQGDEQMMLEACEQISNEGLEASLAIDAVLGTWDMHQIQEPASVQAVQPVICDTCNDHGMIGGPSFYDPGEGGQPCPDCEERHRNGLAAGDLMAWAAEVGGNRIAENVVEMTREDLQRLIAERTPQTAPAAVAVPAKYFSYSGECGIETHTTEAEALVACEEMVQACRDEAADGWPDDVDTIIWGIVLGETKERMLGQVEDPAAAGFDYLAEYDLVPIALAATPEAAPSTLRDIAIEELARLKAPGLRRIPVLGEISGEDDVVIIKKLELPPRTTWAE